MTAEVRLEIKNIQKAQAENLKLMAQTEALEGEGGVVYLDPRAVNSRSRTRPAEYAVYEHGRGGDHAFFDRTISEAGGQILTNAYKAKDLAGMIKRATLDAHRQAVARAHVHTGAMRASLRVKFARL